MSKGNINKLLIKLSDEVPTFEEMQTFVKVGNALSKGNITNDDLERFNRTNKETHKKNGSFSSEKFEIGLMERRITLEDIDSSNNVFKVLKENNISMDEITIYNKIMKTVNKAIDKYKKAIK